MISHKITTIPLIGIVTAALLANTASSASAFTTYFGADFESNASSTFRLLSTPRTTAASNNFLSNLTNPSTENFEKFTPGQVSSFSLNLSSASTATFQGKGEIENVPSGTIYTGSTSYYPTSGNQFLLIGNRTDPLNVPGSTFNSISFSNPAAAIGFYATGLINGLSDTYLELTRTNGTIEEFIFSGASPNTTSTSYFGVIAQNQDEQFTQARFTTKNSRIRNFALDDLTIASFDQIKKSTPVPEPLTILGSLMAAVLGFALRRKYKQA